MRGNAHGEIHQGDQGEYAGVLESRGRDQLALQGELATVMVRRPAEESFRSIDHDCCRRGGSTMRHTACGSTTRRIGRPTSPCRSTAPPRSAPCRWLRCRRGSSRPDRAGIGDAEPRIAACSALSLMPRIGHHEVEIEQQATMIGMPRITLIKAGAEPCKKGRCPKTRSSAHSRPSTVDKHERAQGDR